MYSRIKQQVSTMQNHSYTALLSKYTPIKINLKKKNMEKGMEAESGEEFGK